VESVLGTLFAGVLFFVAYASYMLSRRTYAHG
jgi:hypothetical protein